MGHRTCRYSRWLSFPIVTFRFVLAFFWINMLGSQRYLPISGNELKSSSTTGEKWLHKSQAMHGPSIPEKKPTTSVLRLGCWHFFFDFFFWKKHAHQVIQAVTFLFRRVGGRLAIERVVFTIPKRSPAELSGRVSFPSETTIWTN